MALVDTIWYCNSVGYAAVTVRPQNVAVAAGVLRRQFTAPAVGSERVFVCIIAGTTANVTDATWVLTRGAKTTDGTVTWMECTGQAALNGDLANTATWAQVKAATPAVLGQIIKRSNGASYQICTTAGAMSASEPAFSDTAGVTTTDTTAVWTSLGPVGNFTGGQAPFARLASACASTWFAAGNTVYVSDNHAESQATTITIAPAGGPTTIGKFICHNHSGSYPPVASDITTGAAIATSAAVNLNFTPAPGVYYLYGLTFRTGVGQSAACSITLTAGGSTFLLENCTLDVASTSVTAGITVGSGAGGVVKFNDVDVKFANVAQKIGLLLVQFIWQNTGQVLVSGSTVPNDLISVSSGLTSVVLEALDLSQLTGNIIAAPQISQLLVKDCKLNASVSFPTPTVTGAVIQFVRCDSSSIAFKSARYTYEGTETTEIAITRVGGAVDPTGQVQSRKVVTTANAQWLKPFRAEPYAVWNSTTGSNVTVTVCGTVNAGTLPNNDDIWMECEYLGSATDPLGKIVTTTKASVLASNAAVAADSSTWNNTSTAPTGWNPADVIAVTLSNSNLTATTTAGSSGVRSVGSITSGKYYWEYIYTTIATNSMNVGIATSTYGLVSGSSVNAAFVVRLSGSIQINGSGAGFNSLSTINVGNVIGIAIDRTANLIWFRVAPSGNWNGDVSANPATGIGGYSISGLSGALYGLFIGGSGDVCTANFGASAFTGAVPSGFTAGLLAASTWTPFKLTATLSSPQPQLAGYLHARVRVGKASATYYIDPQVTLS